ncbi:MAG: hypothetical protein KC636_29250, partial [Myxococcales bacterium]|nr:hypothetical protein [Myxococcales bacterium]
EPAENVEQALSKAQIESNWVLIERMRPFVQAHTGSFASFRDAAFAAIDTFLPELVNYKQDILPLLCDYFGVPF